MSNTSNAPAWTEMTPEDFGNAPDPVQGSLFAEADPYGTLDLLDSIDE